MKTMRSSLLALLVAASVSTSALALADRRPQLTVHEGFLSSGEVDSIVRSIRLDSDSVGTYYGPTVLPRSISERLRDLGGTCGRTDGLHEEDEDEGEGEAVMTMLMTSTTDRHRDCHVPQSEGRVVSRGDVAFVFLGSDPEARFEHGNGDGAAVPVVKGNLVKFRGDVPHRTVVPSGSSVRIVGPFHLPTMEYVGSCPEECKKGDGDTCNGGKYWNECKCYGELDDDRRALETLERETKAKDRAMDELENLSLTQGFLRNVVAGQSRDLDECRAYTCREGIGACCDGAGSGPCFDDSEPRGCMQQGKIFMGHGSECVSATTCPPLQGISPEDAELGYCCSTSPGTAPFTMRGYCDEILNGYFVPGAVNNCPSAAEMGACCKQNKCVHTPEVGCTGDADWKGAQTKCKDVCEGACCSAEKCEIVTETGANVTCASGTFNLGQNCMATSCTERCEETLDNAEIIILPDSLGNITLAPGTTVGGDIDNAQDFVEDCQEAILPAGSQWHTFVGNGRMLTITTCSDVVEGGYADHKNFLSLYQDSCANLTCAALDDTSTKCDDGNGYTIKICAEADVKFGLMVHGYGSLCSESEGNYTIAIRDDGSCVPTASPTSRPTKNPTAKPTPTPTNNERPPETTQSPTKNPTAKPTPKPTNNERPPETSRPPGGCDCDCICACECGCISHSGKGKGGTSWGKGGSGKGGTNWSGTKPPGTNWSAGKGSGGKGGSGKGSGGKGGTNWSAPTTSWPGDECNPTTCGCECDEPTHTNWPSHSGKGKGGTSWGKGGSGKGGSNWSGINRALETNWSGKGSSGKGGTNWSGKGGKGYGKGYCGGKGGKGGTNWSGTKPPGGSCVCHGNGKGGKGKGKGGTTWSGKGKGGSTWSGKGKGGSTWSGEE